MPMEWAFDQWYRQKPADKSTCTLVKCCETQCHRASFKDQVDDRDMSPETASSAGHPLSPLIPSFPSLCFPGFSVSKQTKGHSPLPRVCFLWNSGEGAYYTRTEIRNYFVDSSHIIISGNSSLWRTFEKMTWALRWWQSDYWGWMQRALWAWRVGRVVAKYRSYSNRATVWGEKSTLLPELQKHLQRKAAAPAQHLSEWLLNVDCTSQLQVGFWWASRAADHFA